MLLHFSWLFALLLGSSFLSTRAVTAQSLEGGLARSGYIGAGVAAAPDDRPGVVITAVTSDGTAAVHDLRVGDVILRMDGAEVTDLIDYARLYRAVRSGQTVRFTLLRDHALIERAVTFQPYPKEQIEGVVFEYGSLVTDHGHRLRTIVTRPEGTTGRQPAILFVQWLSCASVEMPLDQSPGWKAVMHGLARAGYVMMRVDKPSVGDSEGPDCSETDFATELAGHRAALRELRAREDVDPANLFVVGGSMGGAMAPLVAQNEPVRGVVVWGTHVRTWYEHMLEHERRRLELSGVPLPEVNDRMQGYIELYTLLLVNDLAPAEIIRSRPHLASLWYDGPYHQYGRPARYFQQVQEVNLAAAWEHVTAPVLVMCGEYDWIMSRFDHEEIARIVNRSRAGQATFVAYPKMDHHFMVYESPQQAFDGQGRRFDAGVLDVMLEWLYRQRRP